MAAVIGVASLAPIAMGLVLLGCTPPAQLLDQTPVRSIVVRGDYRTIADCAFSRLHAGESGIRKADLARATKVYLDSSGVTYWELTLSPQPPGTRIELTAARTLIGAFPAEKAWDAAQACAS